MLSFNNSRFYDVVEREVLSGYEITAEGSALVGNVVGGKFGVKPGTDDPDDRFVGVSISQVMNPQQLAITYTCILDDELKAIPINVTDDSELAQLKSPPISGTLKVNAPGGSFVEEDGANGWALTFNVLTFAGNYDGISGAMPATVGDIITVSYRYSPTVAEAQALQGDPCPGHAASQTLDQVGVIVRGNVYTTEYDTLVDWNGDTDDLRVTNGGLFTIGGTGSVVTGYVLETPTIGNNFLGIYLF